MHLQCFPIFREYLKLKISTFDVMDTNKPKNWIGKDGTKYPYDEYSNHGYGGIKNGKKDLPKNNYPYAMDYHKKNKRWNQIRQVWTL